MSRNNLPLGYSYRKKEQRYQHRFSFNGKRYYVYGKTIQECEDKKHELKNMLNDGMNIDNQTITTKSYYNIWMCEQKKSVKESSVYADEKRWKHLEPIFANKKLVDIDKADIIKYQDKMKKLGYSANTINTAVKLLSRILNSAVADRIVYFNPCKNVKPVKDKSPKAKDTNHRALTEDEQKIFFKYAEDSWYYYLFCFLINTGCRIGEATALSWADVDFKNKRISINKTVTRVESGFKLMDSPKTDCSARVIPISRDLEVILKKQRLMCVDKSAFNIKYVFPSTRGGMTNYNNVNSIIRSVIGRINESKYFEHFSVHAFRDTFATRCIEQGMDMNTLKTLLGHKSLKMTMDLYAHVLPETMESAINKIKIIV